MSKFIIAGLVFEVAGDPLLQALSKMRSFESFRYGSCGGAESSSAAENKDALFSIEYLSEAASIEGAGSAEGVPPFGAEPLYTSECDGAKSAIYSNSEGYFVKSWYLSAPEVLLLWTKGENKVYLSGDLSPQILRFTLWLGFGLMAIRHNVVPIHSSAIICNGNAYLFLGESGTGKSTHTRLWRENIHGAELLNDDSPMVSVEDGVVWAYGSPWSGKTHCYRQERYPLKGFVRISQAPYNRITRLSLLQSYGAVHPSAPPEFAYDDRLYDWIGETLSLVLERVPVFHLSCLPDKEAAELSFSTLSQL